MEDKKCKYCGSRNLIDGVVCADCASRQDRLIIWLVSILLVLMTVLDIYRHFFQ